MTIAPKIEFTENFLRISIIFLSYVFLAPPLISNRHMYVLYEYGGYCQKY